MHTISYIYMQVAMNLALVATSIIMYLTTMKTKLTMGTTRIKNTMMS